MDIRRYGIGQISPNIRRAGFNTRREDGRLCNNGNGTWRLASLANLLHLCHAFILQKTSLTSMYGPFH